MKPLLLLIGSIAMLLLLSCNETVEKDKKAVVPAETRSTIEYNQKQLDTVVGNTADAYDFKASGNEPFWGIEVKGDSLVFSSPSERIHSVMDTSFSRSSDTFTGKYDGGTIKVDISEENCTDSMSGREFSHKVKVALTRSKSNEPEIYNGCGSYNY